MAQRDGTVRWRGRAPPNGPRLLSTLLVLKIRETFRVIVLPMALSEKKQEALRLLSSGHTIPKAAEKVGVGRATLWKWTKEPEFSAELTIYKNKEAAGAQMALSHAVYEAVEVLRHIMADEDSTNKERTEAAKIVLDRSKLQLTDAKVKVKGGADALEKWLGSEE